MQFMFSSSGHTAKNEIFSGVNFQLQIDNAYMYARKVRADRR